MFCNRDRHKQLVIKKSLLKGETGSEILFVSAAYVADHFVQI